MAAQNQNLPATTRVSGGQLQAFLKKNEAAMRQVIPQHLTPEKLIGIATNVVNYNPKLQECTLMSLVSCVVRSSQLGLSLDPFLGHAYLVPFEVRRTGKVVATLIVGYKGFTQLAMNSGLVSLVYARAVYERDEFEWQFGTDEWIKHVPQMGGDRGKLTHVYAVVRRKDGAVKFDVMSVEEVNKIRARSKAADNGPWVSDFDEMSKKTVLRRLLKTEPLSPELQKTIGQEEVHERADLVGSGHDVIDVGFTVEDDTGEDRDLSARTDARKDDLKERISNAKQKQQAPPEPPPMPEGMKPVTEEDIKRAEAEVRAKKAAEQPPADLAPVNEFPQVDSVPDGTWVNYRGRIYRFSFADSGWKPWEQQPQDTTPQAQAPAGDRAENEPPLDPPGTLFGGEPTTQEPPQQRGKGRRS